MARVVLVTGMSGSGKSTALRALEDVGYFCMDNLPVMLLPKVLELAGSGGHRRIAVVVDAREPGFLQRAGAVVDTLRGDGIDVEVVYLDAAYEAVLRRFKETRRRHPLDHGEGLQAAVALERQLLDELRMRAGLTLDTSTLTVHDLKRRIQEHFGSDESPGMQTRLVSFGFKHGPLVEADLLFDVRFLPNPHFVAELRVQTGLDLPVSTFVLEQEDTVAFLQRVVELLAFLLPRYEAEGKSYLTIGLGCTGGKHRSVAIAERIGRELERQGRPVAVEHRDRARWTPDGAAPLS